MKKLTISVLIFVLITLLGIGIWFTSQKEVLPKPAKTSGALEKFDSRTNTHSFTITGKDYEFQPNEIRVKKGENVQITFINTQGSHNFSLSVNNQTFYTKILPEGGSQTLSFVVETVGTFEFVCTVYDHSARGQRGNLIVTD